jgi:hypothetical protein
VKLVETFDQKADEVRIFKNHCCEMYTKGSGGAAAVANSPSS